MKELHLLIVEDDKDVQKTYKRNIDSYNKVNTEISIILKIIGGKEKAIEYLTNTTNNIDAAIVDLDLLGTTGEDSSGNEVIREIKKNLRFPVFVISGTPQNLDEDMKGESSLFKIKTRGDEGDYLVEFIEIFNTGITQILNKRGTIEKYITEIFWNHLSNSLDLWIKDPIRTSEEKQKSLLRYTLSHMQEYLELNNIGDLEKYHPAEFFITKPVKENIFTGDILLTSKGDRCVILTPACDIDLKKGIRKADKILTLRIIKPSEIDPEYCNPEMSNGKKQKLQNILSNSTPRYHFIPKAGIIDYGVIDFQDKLTLPVENLEKKNKLNKIERIATISSPFLKDVIARYSNYYSRQGSPDFNALEIYKSLF
ncbi:MAG: response regulator [Lutibacter sp.]